MGKLKHIVLHTERRYECPHCKALYEAFRDCVACCAEKIGTKSIDDAIKQKMDYLRKDIQLNMYGSGDYVADLVKLREPLHKRLLRTDPAFAEAAGTVRNFTPRGMPFSILMAQLTGNTENKHMSECEREGCKNESKLSVGTGEKNIHLCVECSALPEYKALRKRVPLGPFETNSKG